MAKQLGRIRFNKGLASDPPQWEISPEFFSRLNNVVIRSGFPQRVGGRRNAYDPPSAAPLHVFNCPMLGNNFWLYQSTNRIYSVVGGTHTDITPAAGPMPSSVTKPSQWSHAILNGVPIFNNTLDDPCYWLGNPAVDAVTPLTGWPANTRAAMICAHKFHLFALDITVAGVRNGNLFLWSDAAPTGAIPTSWTPSASNEAGFGQLSDTPNFIITGRTLRDTFVIYKGSSAYTVDYVQGNAKFVTKLLWPKNGALAPRAVEDCGGRHAVVTQGDVVWCDAYSPPVSFAEARVKDFIFGQLSTSTYEALQVLYDHVAGDVWILFPESGETYCTIAAVYNIASDAWGIVDLQDVAYASMGIIDDTSPATTWDGDAGTWDSDTSTWNEANLTAAIERQMQAQPLTTKLIAFNTTDAVSLDSLMAKYSMTFDEPERVKFVRQGHLRGRNFGTFFVRVGSQMFPDQAITWSAEVSITNPGQPIPITTQGRYISYEIRGADSAVWEATGFDLEVELRGYF